jgi:mycothiol system anti-sigma-R factor
MTDCGCDEARARMEDYLHGELTPDTVGDVEEHLSVCPPCDEEKKVGETLTNKVKSACCETAPESLKLSIRHRLQNSL